MNLTRTTTAIGVLASAGVLVAGSLTTSASRADESTDRHPWPEPPSRCSTVVEDQNLATFEAYLDDLTNGRIEEAQATFSAEAVVEVHGTVPFAGTYPATGPEYLEMMTRTWQPPSAGGPAPRPQLWADCDQVVLRGGFQRTSITTGEALDTEVVEFFTFEAGKIVRDDFYFSDTQAVNDALTP
jgi:ketosteroid isomerase-like protein